MKTLDTTALRDMLLFVADRMVAQKEYLCEVDARIGDGDHGIGMETGFLAVRSALEGQEFASVGQLFAQAGMAMITSMGGASGILFGSLFLAAFRGEETTSDLTLPELTSGFARSLQEIQRRGKAELGDKTMVDALAPAVMALQEAPDDWESALSQAADAARTGAERTKDYIAKYGRAQFLMERALGYPDAGAVSVSLIFTAMADYVASLGRNEVAS